MIRTARARRSAWLLLLLAAVLGTGCTTTSTPSGGGWKSVTATRTLGMAMREAFAAADVGFAAGRTVTVTSAGFEKDEIGSYLRMLTGEAVHEAGGNVGPDGDLLAQINVNVSGIESVRFYLVPFFDITRLHAQLDAELVVRDRTGTLVTRQPLKGASKYEEAIVLTFFTFPGKYFVRRERAWIAVETSETFIDDLYWHAAGLTRSKDRP